MNRVVASKNTPEFRCRQGSDHRDTSCSDQAGTFVRAAIGGLHHHPGALGLEPFTRLLEAAHRLSCTPRETDKVPHPHPQAGLDPRAQVRGRVNLPARRLCKGATLHGGF